MAAGYRACDEGYRGFDNRCHPSLSGDFQTRLEDGCEAVPPVTNCARKECLPPGVEWVQVVERLPGTWDGPSLDCPCRVSPWSRLINVPGHLMSGLP